MNVVEALLTTAICKTLDKAKQAKPVHKPRQTTFRKCFGTGYSHRLFDDKNPAEPRMSLGSMCPACGISLWYYGAAILPAKRLLSAEQQTMLMLATKISEIVPTPPVIEAVMDPTRSHVNLGPGIAALKPQRSVPYRKPIYYPKDSMTIPT